MKKLFATFVLSSLCIMLLLPCAGITLSPDMMSDINVDHFPPTYDYEGYMEFVESGKLPQCVTKPKTFIKYQQLSRLGEFKSFIDGGPVLNAEMYRYWFKNGILLTIGLGEFDLDAIAPEERISEENLIDPAKLTKVKDEGGRYNLILVLGDAMYMYDRIRNEPDCYEYELDEIVWGHNGINYRMSWYKYEATEDDAFFEQFLNPKTAKKALRTLNRDIDFGRPLNLYMVHGIAGIATLIAAAIALPIVIVKRGRKRRQTV